MVWELEARVALSPKSEWHSTRAVLVREGATQHRVVLHHQTL